ncbi:MAG: UDP-2,3-diacylglucosamine diphosphatase [Chlorobiota bacterium]
MAHVCFFGDVHLGCGSRAEQRRRAELLTTFLLCLPSRYSHVVIIGDLFDFWFDYRTVIPKLFWDTVAALGTLRRRGVSIDYIVGNHDFGHWRFFKEELGIEPKREGVQCLWNGRRFYIAHGDGTMPEDWGYRLLRSLLHSRWAQSLYRLLHPDIGIQLAQWASRASRQHTALPPQRLIASLEAFAAQKLAEGYDVVVLGHSHYPVLKELGNGWYVNPGGWLTEEPLFASFDGGHLELVSVRRFLAAIGANPPASCS